MKKHRAKISVKNKCEKSVKISVLVLRSTSENMSEKCEWPETETTRLTDRWASRLDDNLLPPER